VTRARVYVVEYQGPGEDTWHVEPVAPWLPGECTLACKHARSETERLPGYSHRVVAYDRADCKPLLTCKGDK
jgi:hypothetical protein